MSVPGRGRRACVRVGPKSVRAAASSRTRPRPRRRSRLRAPPRCFYPRPDLLLPQVHRALVPLECPAGRGLPGPTVPLQQPPHSRDRKAQPEPSADHRLNPGQRPALILEPVIGRPLAQLLFQRSKLGCRQLRHARRTRRPQGLGTSFTPGLPPALHRPLADPKIPGDRRGFLAGLEPGTGFQPHLFTTCPPLSSQAPTLRVPHTTGIPRGSLSVTRQHDETLSSCFGGLVRIPLQGGFPGFFWRQPTMMLHGPPFHAPPLYGQVDRRGSE